MSEFEPLNLNNEPFYWLGHQPEISHQAVLLLHGLGGGSYELRPVAERLRALGISVKGINYPGHDKPLTRMPSSTWQEWYAHIEASYQELSQTHRNVSLIGFSTGCPLALKFSHQYPIDKLILLSPFLDIKRHFRFPLAPFITPISRYLEHVPRFGLPIQDRAMRQQAQAIAFMQSFNLRAVSSALELIQDVKPLIPNLQNPTLIIQSPLDTVVDPQGAEYLMQHLGSTQKKLHWLKKSNHIITLDVEREEVFEQILAFLSE